MDEAVIKDYLEKIRWVGFSKKIERASKREILLTSPASGLYHMVRRGVSFRAKLRIKVINIFLPYLMIIWSTLISPVERRSIRKYENFSIIDAIQGNQKDYEIAVVLTSTHPSLYDSLARITKKLDELGVPVLVLTNTKTYKQKYHELKNLKNCKFIVLDYELKSMSWDTYLKARRKSKKQLKMILKNVDDEIILKMLKLYKDYLELMLTVGNIYEKIYTVLFSKIKPTIIIANGFSGALLKVTKNMKIKRIMIQHGTQWGDDTPGVTPDVDELIIWGEFWKENFRKKMSPKAKLVPLGCPRFDEMLEWRSLEKSDSFYNKLGIDKNKATIVFLSNTHGFRGEGFWIEIFRGLEELLNRHGDKINLIVKLHPQESKELYLKTLKQTTLDKIRFIKNEVHLYELFLHTDIAITAGSTSMLEAMAFDIPVIQVNFTDDPEIIDFYKYGGGILIKNKKEFISIILKLLYDRNYKKQIIERQRKFIRSCLTNLGHATDKVIEHVLSLKRAGRLSQRNR